MVTCRGQAQLQAGGNSCSLVPSQCHAHRTRDNHTAHALLGTYAASATSLVTCSVQPACTISKFRQSRVHAYIYQRAIWPDIQHALERLSRRTPPKSSSSSHKLPALLPLDLERLLTQSPNSFSSSFSNSSYSQDASIREHAECIACDRVYNHPGLGRAGV